MTTKKSAHSRSDAKAKLAAFDRAGLLVAADLLRLYAHRLSVRSTSPISTLLIVPCMPSTLQ